MVSTIPVRSVLERLGYKVDYDENTGIIRITDPATGRTGTISPRSYKIKQGQAYINPQYIGSWLRPGLPSSAVAAYTMLDQIPPMNEVISKAQSDYNTARAKGDKKLMTKAQEVINAARMIGDLLGYNFRPADALNPVKRTSSGGEFFDPVTYMWQTALSLPWSPGTKTMTEREMDLRKELELMQQQHEKEMAKGMGDSKISSKISSSEAKNIVKGTYLQTLLAEINRAQAQGGREAAVKVIKEIEKEIWSKEAPEMIKAGIDPEEIIDYLYRVVGGFKKVDGKWVEESDETGGMLKGMLKGATR